MIVSGASVISQGFSSSVISPKSDYSLGEMITGKMPSSLASGIEEEFSKFSISPMEYKLNSRDKKTMIIFLVLREYFPSVLIEIIKNYIIDNALDALYEKVFSKLKLIKGLEGDLNFYDKDFATNLALKLEGKEEGGGEGEKEREKGKKVKKTLLISDKSLANDLARLLFKWMIYMRQFDDDTFMEASKNIDNVISLINTGFSTFILFPLHFDLKLLNSLTCCSLKNLMDCELLEHPHVFDSFSSALGNYYNDGIGREGILKRYFGKDESFDEKLFLKFLIIFYDPLRLMKEDLFPDNDIDTDSLPLATTSIPSLGPLSPSSPVGGGASNSAFSFSSLPIKGGSVATATATSTTVTSTSPSFKLSSSYLANVRSRGPRKLQVNEMEYMSAFIVDFYMKSGKRFVESYSKESTVMSLSLIVLLRKLMEMRLASRETLEKIICFKFRDAGGYQCKWDPGKLESILIHKRESVLSSKDICDYYLRLIKSEKIDP